MQRTHSLFLILGALIGLAGLLAAAFVGGGLLRSTLRGANRELTILPSPLLPAGEGETGLFLSRQDNVIRMGTGHVTIHAVFDDNGQPTGDFDSGYTGPIVEVVVTGETTIYKDVTQFPSFVADADVRAHPIQQTLTPMDAMEPLTADSVLTVWGARSGERITATTLVYKIH